LNEIFGSIGCPDIRFFSHAGTSGEPAGLGSGAGSGADGCAGAGSVGGVGGVGGGGGVGGVGGTVSTGGGTGVGGGYVGCATATSGVNASTISEQRRIRLDI
jgi:hypothetical protein